MGYVKWFANRNRNDGTSELVLADGTVVTMGVPVDLKADVKSSLEDQGRVFTSSSKDEFDEYQNRPEVIQPPGNDVLGTAPVFSNAGASGVGTADQALEDDTAEGVVETPKPAAAKAPARTTS